MEPGRERVRPTRGSAVRPRSAARAAAVMPLVERDQRKPAVTQAGPAEALPGQGWLGMVLLASSAAGPALVVHLLRRRGHWGELVVAAACGVLFLRDVTMVGTGVPGRLRPVPRLLLIAELTTFGVATSAALWAWVGRALVNRRAAAGGGASASAAHAPRLVATLAAAASFVLHTVRYAIYLSPGHGRQEPTRPVR